MEELDIDDILAGLSNAAYADHHIMLLQLLANHVCEDIDATIVKKVQSFSMAHMQARIKRFDAEELDLIFIVLSNLTTADANCELFLEYLSEDSAAMTTFKLAVQSLLGINSTSSLVPTEQTGTVEDDPYQKMASLLCNITRMEAGQKLLLDRKPPCFFPHIIEQMKSADYTRRKGAVGCVRNCLFNSDFHFWMIFELNILPCILRPLIVNTPFTEKERIGMSEEFVLLADNPETRPEKDVEIVKMLMECVLLLCQKRWSRQHLRAQKVYPICRNLDYFLEDDKVNDTMLEIVNFLERDEDFSEHEDVPPIPAAFASSIATVASESIPALSSSTVETVSELSSESLLAHTPSIADVGAQLLPDLGEVTNQESTVPDAELLEDLD